MYFVGEECKIHFAGEECKIYFAQECEMYFAEVALTVFSGLQSFVYRLDIVSGGSRCVFGHF